MVDNVGAVSVEQVRDDGGLSSAMPKRMGKSEEIEDIFK